MNELIGKKANWLVWTANGVIRVEDEVSAVQECKGMILAVMKNTNSIANIDTLHFKEPP